MRAGFAKNDITPRVGVELTGFGPYLCRHSIAVRDALWARALAVELDGRRVILVTCDLIGTTLETTNRVRRMVTEGTGVAKDGIMVASSHTHSGPATGPYIGWGEADAVYMETLPSRIAKACLDACERLEEAELSHAEAPCEGIGINREYEAHCRPMDEALGEDWRPQKPELTDTTCHVITVHAQGKLLGFASYFGCHPVVCCEDTHYIHGDYCGVATNQVERDHPCAVGLFLQGAQGDVNTCVAHLPEEESLRALDVIAARYAKSVREGIRRAKPLTVDRIAYCRRPVTFSRKDWDLEKLRDMLAEHETKLHALDAMDMPKEEDTPEEETPQMRTVYVTALRRLIARAEAGQPLAEPTELQGVRIGPLTVLGSPSEIFQSIKDYVLKKAVGPTTLVASFANDSVGYAVDKAVAARGGYAADLVPFINGTLPYANIQKELTDALLELDTALRLSLPVLPP